MDPLSKGQDSLELFDFGVLLQALSSNLKVGVLAVRSGPREKFLRLEGSNVRCVYTAKARVTLQKVLFNQRAIERAPLRIAAQELGPDRTEQQLAEWLLEREHITPEQLWRARCYQMLEEVLELFYWPNMAFEFHADAGGEWDHGVAQRGLQPVGEPVAVPDLLAACAKTIDDIAKFNSVTPSLRDVYELQFASLQELERAVPDRAQREFMLLIDGVRDMREVLADMRMNRFDVLELFSTFRGADRIRPKNSFELLMLAENRRSEFSPEKRMRVLERVNELGVEGFGVVLPLAETYEKLGKQDRAADCYARHARLAAQADQLDGALASARRAVELDSQDADHQRLEIELLLRAGREQEAAAGLGALADILSARGDHAGALDALRRAQRRAPDDAALQRRIGDALAAQGALRRAAVHMRRAGDAYLDAERAAEAVECYGAAIGVYPRGWSARLRLAAAHHAAGRGDLAIQAISDHVAFVGEAFADQETLAVQRLLDAEERLRDLGGFASSAARHLADAYRSFGRDADAGRALREGALSLLAARRPSSAAELCGDLIDLCPEDVPARRIAARCHAALGDRNQALAQLRRVAGGLVRDGAWDEAEEIHAEMLEIDPGSLEAQLGLARALLHTGREEEASEHYRRAGLLHRGGGRAADALALFCEAAEKLPADRFLLAEYCELLLAAGEHGHETRSALVALAELHALHGEPAEAARTATRLLALDPQHVGAREAIARAAVDLRRTVDGSSTASRAENATSS
jgi:tetratricopeptide (TPR) repeat protein